MANYLEKTLPKPGFIELKDIKDQTARKTIGKILNIYEVDGVAIQGESDIVPDKRIMRRAKPRGSRLFYTVKTGRGGGVKITVDVPAGTEKEVESRISKLAR